MAKKITKAQQKRLVKSIYSKVEKLYFASDPKTHQTRPLVSLKELEAQRKMCNRWLKLLG